MRRIQINERDTQKIAQWAKENGVTPERIVAWLIQEERIRVKTGPALAEHVKRANTDFAVEEDT